MWLTAPTTNMRMPDGPPIEDVVTAFDDALTCLRGKIRREVIFAVGQVVDHTGKENYSEGGSGKFVSQGAGEMVQSALYRAGVSVVNRRDPNISIVESNWGIRDIKRQVPVNFYVSGSINSLDFIPGGGGEVNIAGIGPRYRQNRILIGLDLTMTDAYTGRVVANVPLQKQIFSREVGFSAGRFFGETLVTMDAGGMEREAVHFALRQMLSLATFELLGQIMNPGIYTQCRDKVNAFAGNVSHTGTADRKAVQEAMRAAESLREDALLVPVRNAQAPAPAQPAAQPAAQQRPAAQARPGATPAAAPPPAGAPGQPTAPALARAAISAAVRAISLAKASEGAATQPEAVEKSAESLRLANLALGTLQKAAAAGLNGDDGDAAAVVVQQAIEAARKAALAATTREEPEAAAPEAAPQPTAAVEPAAPAAATPADAAPEQAPAPEPAANPAAEAPAAAVPVPGTPDHLRRFGQ